MWMYSVPFQKMASKTSVWNTGHMLGEGKNWAFLRSLKIKFKFIQNNKYSIVEYNKHATEGGPKVVGGTSNDKTDLGNIT